VARARRAVQDGSMMPTEMPVLAAPPVILREFRDADAALVQSVADDPLIPLITTVPVTARLSPGSETGWPLARATRLPLRTRLPARPSDRSACG
jgi:hypothetical protein